MNYTEHGNKSKKYHVALVVILLACICMLIQMYAIPVKNMRLMSLANRFTVVLWIAAACISLFMNGTKDLMEIIAIFGLGIVAFLFSIFDNMRTYSLTSLLNFYALPMMIIFVACNEIGDLAKKMLLITFFILSLLFIGFSRSSFAYRLEGEYAIINIDDLTMGYPNQNQAAFYLFICAINLVIGAFYFKHKFIKAVFVADFLYMLVLLEQTQCRTSLLLIGVFVLLIFIPKNIKTLVNVAVLWPLVFALLAQWLYPYLEDFAILGDTFLNGREEIYSRYFDNLSVSTLLLGDFQKFHFDNLHNAYVSIAATVGLPVLILFMYMLRKHMQINCELGINKGYESVAFIGFICAVLYFGTEAATAVGGTNYAFMNISLLAYYAKPFAQGEAV